MSSPALAAESSRHSAGDSFAIGIMAMLLLSVLQRCVGLLRGIGFCHYLNDVELGHWALANSFFTIGVPLATLGLPGSFGKFVSYYRGRGQFGYYLRQVAWVSWISLTLSCTLILIFPESFSWLILGQASPYPLVVWCVAAFACVAAFSFVNELTAALRQVRAVSIMQFTQSFTFATMGLVMIAVHGTWTVLLPSFAIASLLGMLPGLWVLRTQHSSELIRSDGLSSNQFWARILPYAGALWLLNLLGNMFEVSDRYMLLHLTPGGEAAGQALVGQYHAGYILPNLLKSLALMLSGILLPYLSADWEAKDHAQLAARLRQMLQSVCIGFIALSAGAMSVAPWLYDYGFSGRYQLALQVLPFALLQATWVSLFLVGETYLLCVERGKRLALLLVLALAANLGLNVVLIQQFGLIGAVAATSAANLLGLMLLFWLISRAGCRLGVGTFALCLMPLSILAGPAAASLALMGILFVAGRTNWLLAAADRDAIDAAILPSLSRCGISLPSLWP